MKAPAAICRKVIQRLLRWAPATPLRDGMERTYRWIYDEMAAGAGSIPAAAAVTAAS